MAKDTKANGKLRCTECEKEKAANANFYLSRSEYYKGNLGRMPVCKPCLYKRFESYMKLYNNNFQKALYHICMNFDIYFDKTLCERSASQETITNTPEGIFKEYMKNINSLPNYNGMTSVNSNHICLCEDESETEVASNKKKVKEEYSKDDEVVLTDRIRQKWGSEYTDEQCIRLEEYYRHYFKSYNHDNDAGKLDILEEVCTYRLIKAQAVKEKDNKTIKDFTELISKRMTDAGLKPSQQKVSGEADEDIFGMQCYIFERKEPIPTPLKEYLDVDKFWKYINKHMIKPLAVALGIAKGEYTIEGGDSEIELSPKMQEALEESFNE